MVKNIFAYLLTESSYVSYCFDIECEIVYLININSYYLLLTMPGPLLGSLLQFITFNDILHKTLVNICKLNIKKCIFELCGHLSLLVGW